MTAPFDGQRNRDRQAHARADHHEFLVRFDHWPFNANLVRSRCDWDDAWNRSGKHAVHDERARHRLHLVAIGTDDVLAVWLLHDLRNTEIRQGDSNLDPGRFGNRGWLASGWFRHGSADFLTDLLGVLP